MSKIFAVDYDGCLMLYKQIMLSEINAPLVAKLVKAQKMGHKIILWTCRENQKLQDAVDVCKRAGLEFDAVNQNVDQDIEADHKVRADLYIDDLGMHQDKFILDYEL